MMNVSPNVQEDDVDGLQLPIMAEGDSAEDNRGDGEEEGQPEVKRGGGEEDDDLSVPEPVSYTHLTLPTICSV